VLEVMQSNDVPWKKQVEDGVPPALRGWWPEKI